MDVLEIGEFADFSKRHEGDWRRIAAESDRATVFQTWEWMSVWWRHQGRGKRFSGLVFSEDGAVVGLAALFRSAFPTILRTWRLVGNGGSDYLDILAATGHEAAVSTAFRAALAAREKRWDWVDLQQARPDAIVGETAGAERRPRVAVWRGETCPFLALPADWESFRRGLGKKLRANVGYYARSLEKVYTVEIRTATEETLLEDLDAFFYLHQRRWNQRWMPGAFASRRERGFHAEAARALLAGGMLRLHTLSLDGEIQAALYCFQKAKRCYYYLGGFEPKFARLSIGTVLTAHAIRYAIEQDAATEFDFLRGDEGYKYKWGAVDRFNRRLSLTHPGLRPGLLESVGRISLSVEQALKGYMHRKHAGAEAKSAPKRAGADG